MTSPDRLAELRRQRALLQQHADWLDREIAAAQAGAAPHSVGATAAPSPASSFALKASPAPVPFVARDAADPETILSQYRSDEVSLKTDVRKGCLLYCALALVLLALGVFALYFLLRGR